MRARAASLLALGAMCALAAPAGASGYVVRLAVSQGRPAVSVRAKGLTVLDGDVHDRLVTGRTELKVRASRQGLRIPGTDLKPRSVLLRAEGPIRVDGRQLIGQVEVVNAPGGLTVINRLPLERYLRGVLAVEMGPDWPLEALEAQAVAARTYFLHRRLAREDANWDLSSSTLDQVYRGIARESAATRRAVEATRGEVLVWGNRPAEALFHACCGGRTRAAAEVFGGRVPYLKAVDDPDCAACPKHRWRREIAGDRLARLLARKGLRGRVAGLRSDGETLVFAGTGGSRVVISRQGFRRLVGQTEIPSARFTAKWDAGRLRITGRGSGHGVGLCQWGARGMAEKGQDHRAILKRYYPGTRLRKMY
jgi:stage II sporulation protein D